MAAGLGYPLIGAPESGLAQLVLVELHYVIIVPRLPLPELLLRRSMVPHLEHRYLLPERPLAGKDVDLVSRLLKHSRERFRRVDATPELRLIAPRSASQVIVMIPDFTAVDRQHRPEQRASAAAEQPPCFDLDRGEEEVRAIRVQRFAGEPLAVQVVDLGCAGHW